MDNKDDGGDAKKPLEKSEYDKKTKESPVTTAVLKLNLHCQGCIQKIRRIVTKTKGFTDMCIDKEKELLMVKGSMDMKVLAESLKECMDKEKELLMVKGSMDMKVLAESLKEKLRGPSMYIGIPQEYFSDENPNACSIM